MEYKINFPSMNGKIEVKLVNRQLELYENYLTHRWYICNLTDEDIKTNIKVDNKAESFIRILDSENIKFEWNEIYILVLKYINGSLIMWVEFDDKDEQELIDLIVDLKLKNCNAALEIEKLKCLIDKLSFEKKALKTQNKFLQEEIDILKPKNSIS